MAVQRISSVRRRRPVALAATALVGAAIAVAGCGGDSQSGASAGEVAGYVPSGSPLYMEVTTDLDGPQWTQVDALAQLFPAYPQLRAELDEALRSEDVDFDAEIAPLLGERAALAGLALPGVDDIPGSLDEATPDAAARAADDLEFMAAVEIADGKDADVTALLTDEGATVAQTHEGVDIYTDGDEMAAAVADGVLLISDTPAQVVQALEAHAAGGDRTLAGTEKFQDALAKLPADVFGQAYIDLGSIIQQAGQDSPELQQLGLGDYQNAVLAASVAAESEGVRVKGVVLGVPEMPAGEFSPTLTRNAPADSIAYLGFSDLAGSLTTVLDQLRAGQSGEAIAQFDALAGQLPALLGVSVDDLSALTSGEHAIVVTPGRPFPGAALALKVEDGARATQTLDALRVGIPRLIGTFSPATELPAWRQVPLGGGISGWSLPLSPEAGAVYGVDGDLAVIGTSVPAVTSVQAPVSPLADDADFQAAIEGMPDQVTSLAWLDIPQVIATVQQVDAGAIEADVLANLRPLKSVSAWTTGGETPTFDVFLRIAE